MKFSGFTCAEEIQDYQRRVLSRTGRSKKDKRYLFHYTDIDSVLGILESGYVYLSSCRGMNDAFEEALLTRHDMQDSLFYLCLTKAKESLAMYKMYQEKKENSVVIKLSFSDIEGVLRQASHGESAGGINDDGKYVQYHRIVELVRNNKLTSEVLGASLYCAEVLYVDPEDNAIKSRGDSNTHIRFPLREKDLIGTIKYQCWNYEQEVRLCCYTERPLRLDEKVAIKLTDAIYDNMVVVLGPGFDNDAHAAALNTLREYGIRYTNSIYRDVYAGVL